MRSDKRLIVPGRAEDYLRSSDLLDFDDVTVSQLAGSVRGGSEADVLRGAFELVRDRFTHSFDAGAEAGIACSASDVVRLGHGLCYAKSHLLAAILRCNGIPTGFCYQRMKSEQGGFVLHGFNAVFIGDRWVRIDARGNNERVRVTFDLEGDMLAYPVDESAGECEYPVVFAKPDAGLVRALRTQAGGRPRDILLPGSLSCPLESDS
ncbi:MAG TPA: transglutaminase family protein [Methanocella sp.]|jgi:transglutaminase-like putative cysteine protease